MYSELRSFRHDYHNVMISLNQSIKTKDLSVIEDTYARMLETEGIVLEDDHYAFREIEQSEDFTDKRDIFHPHYSSVAEKYPCSFRN